MVIPANIRFKHYETFEEVKFENKFTVVPLTIPLHGEIEVALNEIPKITKKLRSGFGKVYAMYACTMFSAAFLPYFLMNYVLMK